MPVPPSSTADLLDLLAKSGAADPGRVAAAVPDPAALPPDPKAAARVLVQKGLVTRFQADQLLGGRYKGFRLGSHLILDLLGRGGMGAVYLAEHTELHRKVAVKVLTVGRGEDHKLAAERFLREARAAAALDHPNIVRIFDVSRQNDLPYLVMEYVEGETLQQVVDRDGVMPYPAAADAIAQAAAGLQHAHERGFVHRDIKPANLMRDRSGVVKILDMGLARSLTTDRDKLTERLDAGAVVGTADFIAPEQALNTPQVDIRADIYSLGAAFFSLLAGRPPFEGNTAQKLLHHQVSAAPHLSQLDASLPKGVAAVVARMLAKKPADRFQTPAEVIAALAPWLGNSTRVLAGLSRTSLGQGAALHATLADGGRGSSRRLATVVVDDEADEGDDFPPGESAKDTTPGDGPRTARHRAKPRPKARRADRQRVILAAVGGLALALAGAAAAVIALRDPPADTAGDRPRGDGLTPPPPAPVVWQTVYRLAPTNQKAFTVRGGPEKVGDSGRDYRLAVAEKTGDGDFPPGWQGTPYDAGPGGEAAAEFWAEPVDGRWALGLKNLQRTTAMLLSPDVSVPDSRCRVRFEYRTDAATPRAGMFKFKDPTRSMLDGLIELRPLDGTGGLWRPVEVEADLRGATGGFFEWHNLDAAGGLLVRGFEVAIPSAAFTPVRLDRVATATTARPLFDSDKTRDRFVFSGWGRREVHGIPFDLLDPRGEARNVVMLKGPMGEQPQAAPEVVVIPVGRPAAAIHFLGGVAGWGWPYKPDGQFDDPPKGGLAVTVRVRYADGGPPDEVRWLNGEHVADWIKRVDVPGSEFAFPDEQSHQVRLLSIRPSRAGAVVKEVELARGDVPDLAPLVFAVTVEAPPAGK